MKIIIDNRYKFIMGFLILIIGTGLWSCGDDDTDNFSLAARKGLPEVTSLSPTSGILGTELTITGVNFGDSPEDINVTFEGVEAPVIPTASSETSMTLIVPSGAITGVLDISVGNARIIDEPTFIVPLPEVTSYSVTSGILGTEVTITGSNFSSNLEDNAVSFNGVSAEVTEATTTTLTTIVPFGASTGAIMVSVDGKEGEGPEFIVPLPTITGYDVTTGITGDIVVISGTNYSANTDENAVIFAGEAEAEIIETTETSITASVPFGAFTGAIEVNVGGQAVTGPEFSIPTVTLAIGIIDRLDDLEENTTRDGLIFNNSDLEIGETESGRLYNIGLRYQNVPIPQGATITSAYIQFQADADGDEPTEMNIFGHLVGDSEPFNIDIPLNITQRPITEAVAFWNIEPWVRGDRAEAQRTPDMTSIIQEIVSNGDWAPGNSMSFILEPTGVSENATSSSQGREAESDPGSDSATLVVVFE